MIDNWNDIIYYKNVFIANTQLNIDSNDGEKTMAKCFAAIRGKCEP